MRTKRRHVHRDRWIDPHDARLARQAGIRLMAVDGLLWLFDRSTGVELGKWNRETGRLILNGIRVADAGSFAAVVQAIDVKARRGA